MPRYDVEAVLKATGADKFSRAMQGAAKSAERLHAVGGKMKGIGKTMTAAITLPVAGMGTAIAKTGAQFDDQMSTVQAVTGATGKQMDKLRQQAKDMGMSTRYSATEAAEGQEMLARAGFKTDEIMSALPSVLDLAAAGAVDLGDAADITSNILSGFGMEATQTGRVADILAKASADANTDVHGLGEAFKYVGPVASSLGLSIEDTAAAIGVLGDAGIQGGQAGNMLKRGLLNLASPSKQAAELMDELGINVFDANGKLKSMPDILSELEGGLDGMSDKQRVAALETIFGAEAVSGWSAMVGAGSDKLGTFSEELKNSEGAAAEMHEMMEDNLAGSFRSLMSALEGLAISFYEMGEGPLRSFVDWLTNVVKSFIALDDKTKQTIIVIAGIAAAIGPVLIALGMLLESVHTVGSSITNFGKLFGGVSVSMFAWIAVIGLVVAAVVHLYQTNEEFRNNITIIWNSIKDIIMSTFQAILPAAQAFIVILGGIVQALMPVIAWVVNAAAQFLSWIANLIQTHSWITTLIQVLAVVVGVIGGVIAVVTVVAKVFAIVVTVVKAVAAVFVFLTSPIGIVIAVIGSLIAFVVWLGEKFEWLGNLLDKVSNFMSNAWNKFLGFFGKGTKEASEEASDAINDVSEKGKEDLGSFSEEGSESISTLNENVTTNISDMTENSSLMLDSMSNDGIANLENLNIEGVSEISSMNQDVTSDISDMSNLSIDNLKDMEIDGIDATSGLNSGVTSNVDSMSKDVKSEVGKMEKSASGDFGDLKGDMTKNAESIKKSVSKSFKGMSKSVKSEINNIKKIATSGMKDVAINIGQSMVHSINAMKTSLNYMSDEMSKSMNKMANTSQKGMNKIAQTVNKGTNNVNKTTRSGLLRTIQTYVTSFSGIYTAVNNGMNRNVSAVKRGNNRIVSSTKKLHGQLKSIGIYAMSGLRSGLLSGSRSVYATANMIANQVAITMKKALKIHSPSRVTKKIGKWTGEGLAKGINSKKKRVSVSSKKLADEAIKNLNVKFDTKKISATNYIKGLKKIRNQFKLTGEQSRKVQKGIYKGNEYLRKQSSNLKKSIKKINSGVKDYNYKFLNKVKDINKKLKKDIAKVKADFKKKVADTAESIYNQVGLFEGVESKKVDANVLLENLKAQNAQFKKFRSNISKIQKAGVSKAFVQELREMGVSAAAEIEAIANMPKSQLKQYVSAWSEKHKLAKKEANAQLKKEKEAMNKQIKQLTKAANLEIKKARSEWVRNISKLGTEVSKIGSFRRSGQVLGKDTARGLIKGLKSMSGPVAKQAKSLASKVTSTIKRTLKIKSPSRVMVGVGNFIGEGLAVGMKKTSRMVERASDFLAKKSIPDLKSNNISRQVAHANRQLETQFTNEINSSVTVKKQPAYINLVLAGTEFDTFVEDITDVQERTKRLKRRFI